MGFWIRKDTPNKKTPSKKKKQQKKEVAKEKEIVCYKGICSTLDFLENELIEFRYSASSKKDIILLQKLEEKLFKIYEGL